MAAMRFYLSLYFCFLELMDDFRKTTSNWTLYYSDGFMVAGFDLRGLSLDELIPPGALTHLEVLELRGLNGYDGVFFIYLLYFIGLLVKTVI
jgi:hypothetical protein